MKIPNDLQISIRLNDLDSDERVRVTLEDGTIIEGFKWGEVYDGQVRIVPDNSVQTQVNPMDFPLIEVKKISELEKID